MIHDLIIIGLGVALGWSLSAMWQVNLEDSLPATTWTIRRAHKRNRADLRRALGR